tara:strand:+ start:167 stop:517 length:351 start_codon:yes stop_codon:yes gene_type:complete
MITTQKNGMTLIDQDLLGSNFFKYAYTDRLFEELGMEESYGVQPVRGDDPWYIEGDLHGFHVSATFNTYENLTIKVFNEKISYKDSMKDTLNNFIETYREKWNEHHHSRGQREGDM